MKWIESSNGNVPPGAIQVGQTSSREPLYIGRVKHKGSLCVGKVSKLIKKIILYTTLSIKRVDCYREGRLIYMIKIIRFIHDFLV